MTLEEIKASTKQVYWSNNGYKVVGNLIHCTMNDTYTGLTWADGKTLNGHNWQFYTSKLQQIENLYKHICHRLEMTTPPHNDAEDLAPMVECVAGLAKLIRDYPDEQSEDIWYIDTYMSVSIDDLIIGAYWYYLDYHEGPQSQSGTAMNLLATIYKPNMETQDDCESLELFEQLHEEANK